MSASNERTAMQAKMEALADNIIVTEAMAEELTRTVIALLDDQPGARAIRDIAVQKRVRAIELRGQLAALREEYDARFHPD